MGTGSLVLVMVVAAVVFVVIIGVLIVLLVALRNSRNRRTDASAPVPPAAPLGPVPSVTPAGPGVTEVSAWTAAVAEAAAAPERSASGPAARSRETLSREALANPDRTLDTTKWDNRPDGTEEYDEDDQPPAGPSGGPVMDSDFFNSLRERRTGE